MNWREGKFCKKAYNMDNAAEHNFRNSEDEVCPAGLTASKSGCDCFSGNGPLNNFAVQEVTAENTVPSGWYA